jgi:hypothetical protein
MKRTNLVVITQRTRAANRKAPGGAAKRPQ